MASDRCPQLPGPLSSQLWGGINLQDRSEDPNPGKQYSLDVCRPLPHPVVLFWIVFQSPFCSEKRFFSMTFKKSAIYLSATRLQSISGRFVLGMAYRGYLSPCRMNTCTETSLKWCGAWPAWEKHIAWLSLRNSLSFQLAEAGRGDHGGSVPCWDGGRGALWLSHKGRAEEREKAAYAP